MKIFRSDILSMLKKHGSPSFFSTLSSAESMWPETFVEISKGEISLSQAKCPSAKERAQLIAENPVRTTIAWKRRLKEFLDFVLHGQSKPLGEIAYYVQKSEWQGKLSEHVHFLFWKKNPIPKLVTTTTGYLNGPQE